MGRMRAVALSVMLVGLAALCGVGRAAPELTPEASLGAILAATPLPVDLLQIVGEFRGVPTRPVVGNALPPQYLTGRIDRFWIGHADAHDPHEIEAELRLISRHAYWYVQRGATISDKRLQDAAQEFEARIYPGVRRLVGSESFPGLDNDPHITILHGDVPSVAGYVTSSDSYPRTVNPFSNEREMVYLNVNAVRPGSSQYLGTLAHELTHLVHAGGIGADDTWVKEGLAELVASIVLGDGQDRQVYPISESDLPLTSWADADDQNRSAAGHYRTSELFLRYLVDRLSPDVLALLVARPDHGPGSWDVLLKRGGIPGGFAELYGQWVVANVVGTRSGPGVFGYQRPSAELVNVRRLERGDTVAEPVAQFGTDYFELPISGAASLRFTGDRTVPVLSAPGLAGGAWVAARVDATVSHLTCSMDLSTVAPNLTFQLWYDIERDYDFAYVAISTDAGKQWRMVRTPTMTEANRFGTNLGAGYTGKSGGEGQARWIEEVIDLSAHVEQTVAIRFSYVTDDAITREGIAIDAVRAVSVDGGTAGVPCGDWASQGWANVGPELPQAWLVQVIEFSPDGIRVRRVELDREGHGTWSSDGRRIDRAVVAVSAMTPATLQRPSYRLVRD